MAHMDEFITELEKVCGCSGMGYVKCLERVKELKEQNANHIYDVLKLNGQNYELRQELNIASEQARVYGDKLLKVEPIYILSVVKLLIEYT